MDVGSACGADAYSQTPSRGLGPVTRSRPGTVRKNRARPPKHGAPRAILGHTDQFTNWWFMRYLISSWMARVSCIWLGCGSLTLETTMVDIWGASGR